PCITEDRQGNVVLYYMQWSPDPHGNLLNNLLAAYRFAEGRFQPVAGLSHTLSGPPLPVEEIAEAFMAGWVAGDFWVLSHQQVIRYLQGGGAQVYNRRNG